MPLMVWRILMDKRYFSSNETYGMELILDLHNCNVKNFNRKNIESFFEDICRETNMQKCELYFWDDLETPKNEKQTDPQTTGTSAVQFILTSNITIHTLDKLGKVFINFFSCKSFDKEIVEEIAIIRFGGHIANSTLLTRI